MTQRNITTLFVALLCLVAQQVVQPTHAVGEPRCAGREPTQTDRGGPFRGSAGADVLIGTSGPDRFFAGRGNDRICGLGGADLIVGLAGHDWIYGGAGADRISGGRGTDDIFAGSGPDSVSGGRGNDRARGDAGRDRLKGELGDDELEGGSGDDVLIGGLGNERLDGGRGESDVLSGGLGGDRLDGGRGRHDLVSIELLTPLPNLRPSVSLRQGLATGDGSEDQLRNLEDIAGSPYADYLAGDSRANRISGGSGDDELVANEAVSNSDSPVDIASGGPGSDLCRDFESEDSCGTEPPPAAGTKVEAVEGRIGGSLLIAGDTSSNTITVSFRGSSFLVSDTAGATPAGDCRALSPVRVRCPAPRRLRTVLIEPGEGNDSVEVRASVPTRFSSQINGGEGDDELRGGRGGDVISAGSGEDHDVLHGGGGDDGLLATRGADRLRGGSGSDLLVTSSTCQRHRFSGGGGEDSVSFARTIARPKPGTVGVTAKLGTAVFPGRPCRDRLGDDVESLEGSRADDLLIGDDRQNRLLGRFGDDRLIGGGGPDGLVGGLGGDSMLGGAGDDRLQARDGARDKPLDCGRGFDLLRRDQSDPRGRGCER